MNWDQYKDLQYNEERSHSLADFDAKLSPTKLEDLILDVQERNRLMGYKTRVMEIGAGNGRVLIELQKLFPDVEFYAINKEKTHTFYRRESFILTALKFGIYTEAEAESVHLPYVVFQDLDFGQRIPYEEKKFDIVFTQNTMKYIKYKFELMNEIMRVLRPGGLSIHTDMPVVNIYSKGLVMEFRDAMALMRKKDIEISFSPEGNLLKFKKKQDNTLFPVLPHQPIPERLEGLSQELRRPDMGYNFQY